MDPISIALGIAKFAAPKLGKWLFGDDGEKVANEVVGIAKSVTGEDDAAAAAEVLKKNPDLLIQFQKRAAELEISFLEEETKRMRIVNETMRSEAQAGDTYVRRWRPTIGYVVAGQLGLLGIAVFVAVVGSTIAAFMGRPDVVQALLDGLSTLMTSLTAILGIELTVLGVNIAQRSKDKQVATGIDPGPGLIGALTKRIAGSGHG